ncbi:hypothetical protein ACLOJK_038636 [Asimina triloba]
MPAKGCRETHVQENKPNLTYFISTRILKEEKSIIHETRRLPIESDVQEEMEVVGLLCGVLEWIECMTLTARKKRRQKHCDDGNRLIIDIAPLK